MSKLVQFPTKETVKQTELEIEIEKLGKRFDRFDIMNALVRLMEQLDAENQLNNEEE